MSLSSSVCTSLSKIFFVSGDVLYALDLTGISSVVSMACEIKGVQPILCIPVAKQSLYSCNKFKRSCFCFSFKSELLKSKLRSCFFGLSFSRVTPVFVGLFVHKVSCILFT